MISVSKVTICDMCNKEIAGGDVAYSFVMTRTIRDFIIGSEDEYHLCSDCQAKVFAFVGEPND